MTPVARESGRCPHAECVAKIANNFTDSDQRPARFELRSLRAPGSTYFTEYQAGADPSLNRAGFRVNHSTQARLEFDRIGRAACEGAMCRFLPSAPFCWFYCM